MSRRRGSSRRRVVVWLWVLLAVADVLLGAYLWDEYGAQVAVLGLVVAVAATVLTRPRGRARRAYRRR